MSTPIRRVNPVKQHNRAVLVRIILPVALTSVALLVFVIALLVGTATGSLESKQVTVISGVLLTVFVMIPMVILCLVPCALLLGAVYGAGWIYARGQQPLRTVRELTTQISQKTDAFAPKAAAPFVAFNLRFTRWEQIVRRLRSSGPSESTRPDQQ